MSSWEMKCDYCQRQKLDLRRCTRCFMVYYCSKECQSLDWSSHRISCTKPPKGSSNEPRSSTAKRKTDTGKTETSTQYFEQHEKSNTGRHSIQGNDHGNQGKTTDENTAQSLTEDTGNEFEDGLKQEIEKLHVKEMKTEINNSTGTCNKCLYPGCNMKCARCQVVFYCSKSCQKNDWPLHKTNCRKHKQVLKNEQELTDAEKAEVDEMHRRQQRFHMQKQRIKSMGKDCRVIRNYDGPIDRLSSFMLTPEKQKIHKTRPEGSLEKALFYARNKFPQWAIIDDFDEVPPEIDSLYGIPNRKPSILVAFIFMYHDHVMRHAVFLKDSADQITHVQFYFDSVNDNPYPYFSYHQLKPGNYILIKNPEMHFFMDGQVGLRINHPSQVNIFNME